MSVINLPNYQWYTTSDVAYGGNATVGGTVTVTTTAAPHDWTSPGWTYVPSQTYPEVETYPAPAIDALPQFPQPAVDYGQSPFQLDLEAIVAERVREALERERAVIPPPPDKGREVFLRD